MVHIPLFTIVGQLRTRDGSEVNRLARDEEDVRRTLDYVWGDSEGAERILEGLQEGNEDLCKFEKMLETQ